MTINALVGKTMGESMFLPTNEMSLALPPSSDLLPLGIKTPVVFLCDIFIILPYIFFLRSILLLEFSPVNYLTFILIRRNVSFPLKHAFLSHCDLFFFSPKVAIISN